MRRSFRFQVFIGLFVMFVMASGVFAQAPSEQPTILPRDADVEGLKNRGRKNDGDRQHGGAQLGGRRRRPGRGRSPAEINLKAYHIVSMRMAE
jgi:hypothetical protein